MDLVPPPNIPLLDDDDDDDDTMRCVDVGRKINCWADVVVVESNDATATFLKEAMAIV